MSTIEKVKPVLLPFGETIYQITGGQGISSDTSFLVNTVLAEETNEFENVMDIGSGIGIICFMLKHYRPNWNVTGIEIQKKLVDLAKENSRIIHKDVEFTNQDIRTYKSKSSCSLIISNPPFYPVGRGRISPVYERAVSRHEILCNLEDLIESIGRNLATGGRSYFLHLTEKFEVIEKLLKAKNMELDKIFSNISCQKKRIQIYRIQR